MKNVYQSFLIAFRMYSKIPVPEAEWKSENMRYIMCFFPMVGMVIGVIWRCVYQVLVMNHVPNILQGGILFFVPLFLTGGIHFDGLIDTFDALGSHQSMDRKLEIMKDSHVGAFGVIGAIGYAIVLFSAYSCMSIQRSWWVASCFVASRILSGLAVVTFPCAKDSGLVNLFSNASERKIVRRSLYGYLGVIIITWFTIQLRLGLLLVGGSGLLLWYYYRMSKKNFGGITGDLAGFFLQSYEVVSVILIVIIE